MRATTDNVELMFDEISMCLGSLLDMGADSNKIDSVTEFLDDAVNELMARLEDAE